jgi:YYY domain-containing protein
MKDLLAFFSWYLVIFLIGLLSLPIASRLFPRLSSRGYAFIRPMGLLVWGYVFWLLCSLGVLQNDLGGVLLALLALLAFSGLLLRKGKWAELKLWLKDNWRFMLVAEIVFLVLFAGWAVVRAANPDAAYTEKPMELAFINSILRSEAFPPQDPWLSGYSISYYYFGYVLISMLIRVTGVASSVAFNLTSALWFGITGVAAYGLVHDLLFAWKGKNVADQAGSKKNGAFARLGALLGPFFLLLIGNLEGFLELLYARHAFWKVGADGTLTSRFWNWLGILELNTPPTQPLSWLPNRSAGWIWWRGSRVIQDLSLSGANIEVIDEFPFFTYLISDLHPHLLAMPFCLLAIALALNAFLSRGESDFPLPLSISWLKRWQSWLTILVLGSLAFFNTWDFPIYVGLYALVVIYKRVLQKGWAWRRGWEFLQCALYLGVGGILLFLPFYLGFQSQAGGVLPSLEYITRGVNFWVMFGCSLSLILLWLMWQIKRGELVFDWKKSLKVVLIGMAGLFLLSLAWGWLLLSLSDLGWALSRGQSSLSALLGAKASLGGQFFTGLHENYPVGTILQEAILRRIDSPGTWITLLLILIGTVGFIAGISRNAMPETLPERTDSAEQTPNVKVFIVLLILLGTGLTLFPEFFYLRDQFGWRMNTIFKFYFQAWALWSLAVAFISVELFSTLKRWGYLLFSVFWAVLVTASLAYPVLMVLNRTNNFNPVEWTLDGDAYIARYTPDEYAAMQWLKAQPTGIIAEAVGGSYSDYARVSTRTGFPTVLGWPGHESQWRGGATEMGSREQDIRRLYETDLSEEMFILLNEYGIRYIYLGNLERVHYQVNQEKFDNWLSVIYANGSVTIYEVPAINGE